MTKKGGWESQVKSNLKPKFIIGVANVVLKRKPRQKQMKQEESGLFYGVKIVENDRKRKMEVLDS